VTKKDITNADHARITRRGQQIFQIALRMEIGDVDRAKGGAETLLYLANAIAFTAAISEDPRLALGTVVGLFDKIDDAWFAKQHGEGDNPVTESCQLLADAALETALGQGRPGADIGGVAAVALSILTDAIVRVAALNSNPRQIIEHVVQRLDATDVDAVRKEQLK